MKKGLLPEGVAISWPPFTLVAQNNRDSPADKHVSVCRKAAAQLRLTVSGSAACPLPIMDRWEQLSGARLLERYGMTETGMVVSNPYKGEMQSLSAMLAFVRSLPSPSDNL